MLKVGHSEAFWYPVKVKILDENGEEVPYEFKARFRRLSREALVSLPTGDDRELMRENLLGWSGIVDDAENPLPFTPENMELVFNIWPVLPAMAKTFIEAQTYGGRVKN
jgi:hypothetical protein